MSLTEGTLYVLLVPVMYMIGQTLNQQNFEQKSFRETSQVVLFKNET